MASVQASGATAAARGTLDTPFDTVTDDETVTVNHTAHGLAVGDRVSFSGASSVGSNADMEMNGDWIVATVPDADSYTLEHTEQATTGASGEGGSGIEYGHEVDLVADETTAGTYQLVVDADDLADGEELQIRVFGEARSGDAERLLFEAVYRHAQGIALVMTPGIVSPHHLRASILQLGGSARTYEWALYAA